MSVNFGPTTSLAVIDTPQVSQNAATSIVTSNTSGSVTIASGSTSTAIVSVSATARPQGYTAVVTVNGVLTLANGSSATGPGSAAWDIVDNNSGFSVKGTSQGVPSIGASSSTTVNLVLEVSLVIAANTAVSYSFQIQSNLIGGAVSGSAIGTIKLEQVLK